MNVGKASGLQIAFFTFAVVLLATAGVAYVTRKFALTESTLIARTLIFLPTLFLFVVIPPLRRSAIALLSTPIPPDRIREVAGVAIAKAVVFGLAMAGGIALWYWLTMGPEALEKRLLLQAGHEIQMAHSTSLLGLLALALAVIFAPLLEELVFRGYLYRAWEARWGWVPAMLASSLLFAAYHKHFMGSFTSALVFVALFRRTGSLWAPILVHAVYNLMIWYPLMGRHMFPHPAQAGAGLGAWSLQLFAFFITVVAIAAYLWMARKPYASRLSVAD